ncbi:MAG: ATPase, partial [Rhodothermales bacterium]
NDEKDIGAALVGTGDASALRKVLASLDSKQQALILGHAVPMPIVVKTRTYDETFYRAMRDTMGTLSPESYDELKQQMDDLFY